MRLPRDVSGQQLAKTLATFGYRVTRQTGSHLRLTTEQGGEHHLTIPLHDPLRIGTLSAILLDVAKHFGWSRQEVEERKPRRRHGAAMRRNRGTRRVFSRPWWKATPRFKPRSKCCSAMPRLSKASRAKP
jgi:predicted RNA binding protein YcfA (HicA-like mRNA interferase family)